MENKNKKIGRQRIVLTSVAITKRKARKRGREGMGGRKEKNIFF